MTRDIRSTRPARAAIAAVLALSATPLLAQEVAPSQVAPTPITPAPTTPAAEPAAPQIAPLVEAATPAATPAANAPVMAPTQPVVQATPSVEERKAEAIAQAEAARAEAAPALAQREQKRPAARAAAPTPAPVETVAAAPVRAFAPLPAEAALVEPTPAAPEMAASTPVEPAAVTPPVANDAVQMGNSSDALTWGLAGGALLLVGAAGTMAMRRRRNRAGDSAYRVDEGVTLHTSEGIVTVPETALEREPLEPAFTPVAPSATRKPLAVEAPHGSLDAMVDAPPSPANPFLTRGNRLRRAQFLLAKQADGTERNEARVASVAPQATPVDRSQTVYRFGKDDARRSGLMPRTR